MKKSKSNIDYRLLERREISDYLDSLNDKKLTNNALDEIISDLVHMGDQVIPVCLSKLKFADEDLLIKLSYIIEVLGDESIIPSLMQIVKDPILSDEQKTVILNILCGMGVDPVDLPMEEIFEDFDQVAENAVQKILADISDEQNIPNFLNEFSAYPEDVKIMLIDEFAAEGSEVVINMLNYLARAYDFDLINHIIHGLGKIGTPASAGVLKELVEIPEIRINSLATKELQKLKMLGIEPKGNPQALRHKQGELYKVLISSIDGRGSRVIWFIWRINNRKTLLQTTNFLINTEMGIKDCWGFTKITQKELDKMIDRMEEGVSLLEDELEYALLLLRDGLNINLDQGYPIPTEYGYWSTCFDPKSLYPKSFKPDFSVLDIGKILANEQLYEDTDLLHEMPEFSDWFIAEPTIYEFADKYLDLERKFKNKEMYRQQLESLKERFVNQFLFPQKDLLKINLEKTVDFLLRQGQIEKATVAMAALLNIESKPLSKQPLIKRIFWESLNIAISNMNNGYDMRTNPDDFE